MNTELGIIEYMIYKFCLAQLNIPGVRLGHRGYSLPGYLPGQWFKNNPYSK